MIRKQIFVDVESGQEIILPVPPSSYEVSDAQGTQVVNLTQFGDYALAGDPAIEPFDVACMLPAQRYPFLTSGGSTDPNTYLTFFERAIAARRILRYVVSDTLLSREVLVQRMTRREQDGTNDVYLTLTLLPYRRLQTADDPTIAVAGASGSAIVEGAPRTGDAPVAIQQAYRAVLGDTLFGVARKFYGDSGLAVALAAYNGIKNVNLLLENDLIELPAKAQLQEG